MLLKNNCSIYSIEASIKVRTQPVNFKLDHTSYMNIFPFSSIGDDLGVPPWIFYLGSSSPSTMERWEADECFRRCHHWGTQPSAKFTWSPLHCRSRQTMSTAFHSNETFCPSSPPKGGYEECALRSLATLHKVKSPQISIRQFFNSPPVQD